LWHHNWSPVVIRAPQAFLCVVEDEVHENSSCSFILRYVRKDLGRRV